MTAPLIAVTMGDPAGIGPEILAKTFAEEGFWEENRALVVGDAKMLERAARLLDLPLRANVVTPGNETKVGETGGGVPRTVTWPPTFSGAMATTELTPQPAFTTKHPNQRTAWFIRYPVSAAGKVDGACPWSPT